MKAYEWIIKIISYIICCAAVCAGFALKERKADEKLQNYLNSEREENTAELCGLLIRLKNGLADCISDETDNEAYSEVEYCCKAASDAVCRIDSGKNSEPLRMFFDRVKNVCKEVREKNGSVTVIKRQPLSELYMRLSAVENELMSGKTDAARLISALSSGLYSQKDNNTPVNADRISMSSAEKRAYELTGSGVRLKNCGMYDGNFIFASDLSCAVLTNKGEPYIKSRTVTEGSNRIGEAEAAKTAEKRISEITGVQCHARLDDKLFGIYYFTVFCGEKEYPVGIDKTDGKTVFEVIIP